MHELATEQLADISRDGFVRIPQIVPAEVAGAALNAINASMGRLGLHPADLPVYRMDTFCPELQSAPEIMALLYETPLWELAQSAIGAGRILPVSGGQIALRFPSADTTPPIAHIDGLFTAPFRAGQGRAPLRARPPQNVTAAPKVNNFTALVGVYLNDVQRDDGGNLTVWPGSHRAYEAFYREHGPEALLDGMPDVDIGKPEQLHSRAGDGILCHYQLGHGIAPNSSPNIRYAVYFRLYRAGHSEIAWESMTDIWREWDGVKP